MYKNFDKVFHFIMEAEGAYKSNTPAVYDIGDRHKTSRWGITDTAWVEYAGSLKGFESITEEDAKEFFKRRYWDTVRSTDLPTGLDFVVTDMAYNAGASRAAKLLQRLVGSTADGVIGLATLKAVDMYVSDRSIEEAIEGYSNMREDYYKQLKQFKKFGKGWISRVNHTKELALDLT